MQLEYDPETVQKTRINRRNNFIFTHEKTRSEKLGRVFVCFCVPGCARMREPESKVEKSKVGKVERVGRIFPAESPESKVDHDFRQSRNGLIVEVKSKVGESLRVEV